LDLDLKTVDDERKFLDDVHRDVSYCMEDDQSGLDAIEK
jgi:hypothetical protein